MPGSACCVIWIPESWCDVNTAYKYIVLGVLQKLNDCLELQYRIPMNAVSAAYADGVVELMIEAEAVVDIRDDLMQMISELERNEHK